MGASFEDLEVWKKSCRLAVDVYKALVSCRDYSLKDQMCRSAISVPSNIAEGRERNSKAEFVRFLNISKGSAGELRTQFYIASELNVIEKSISSELINRTKELSQMLQGLIKSIQRKV